MKSFSIRKPDDMHFHPRSGDILQAVLPYTAKYFARGLVMGNLPKPVITADDAIAYREEVLAADSAFQPIMTVMLARKTTPEIITEAFDRGFRVIKFIPGSASTNSDQGISLENIRNYYPVLETAEKLGMILSGHWESVNDEQGKPFPELKRELAAIPFLDDIVYSFPGLNIIVEHASTKEMIRYVTESSDFVSATLTAHHALLTYDEVCDTNGKVINPYLYCKPVAKNPSDKKAVTEAMISGNPKFFFGSDSAPHLREAKEKTPPAAGIFTAPVALPLLFEIFEHNGALSKLEDFVSRFGARFYGLPLNKEMITLVKEDWIVPKFIGDIPVFCGGEKLSWRIS